MATITPTNYSVISPQERIYRKSPLFRYPSLPVARTGLRRNGVGPTTPQFSGTLSVAAESEIWLRKRGSNEALEIANVAADGTFSFKGWYPPLADFYEFYFPGNATHGPQVFPVSAPAEQMLATKINPLLQDTSGVLQDREDLIFLLDGRWHNNGVTETWDDILTGEQFTVDASIDLGTHNRFGFVEFDGANTAYNGPNLNPLGLTEAEVFIALRRRTNAAEGGTNTGFAFWGNSGQVDHYAYQQGIYSSFGSTARHICGIPAQDISKWHVLNIWSAPNDWNLNINGTSVYSTVSNTVNFFNGPINIGRSYGGVYHFDGDIMAVALYNKKLSTAARIQVEKYFQNLIL